ncbi:MULTISPECIES: exonuclease domain-containing protein [unclassified Flavobacterium]|uniref:exonuclease domain-containing protein n=1 Tax=unclassified Flavobacterium TaxID=196869 RepID=UPI003F8DAE4C
MKNLEYAIVDIETTGGNASHSRITEIAIVIHNGENVINRFETLINPQKEIPLPIFALTGINNEMVSQAPLFEDVAEKILQLLSGRIFVAHNVNFDYSFVRHELEKSGLQWTARKLCTVRAARKIIPGLHSYSLGKLCSSLNIGIENRHRAGGDADATVELFAMLLDLDEEGVMTKMIKNNAQDQRLPPNLPPSDFETLPEKPGIYYFYNQEKKVIYVGKAINIKKRVASHFTGHSIKPQRQNFLRDIHAISYEISGTELMALLLECTEIKKLWPQYNRALKKYEAKYGLFTYEARNGYKYLAVGKLTKFQLCVQECNSLHDGIHLLQQLAEQFKLDYRFCTFPSSQEVVQTVQDISQELPEIEEHNRQMDQAISFLTEEQASFAIIDKGRSTDERSCIWVENGLFYGMGYIGSDVSCMDPSELKDYIIPYKSNPYIMQLLYSFAAKNKRKVFFKKNFQNNEVATMQL